jgi:peptidoglycan/LPS O-acetylase OafA/YrhL
MLTNRTMYNCPKKKRLPEIDILKSLAIFSILMAHMHIYIVNIDLIKIYDSYFASFGLSIFFFVSGYTLAYSDIVSKSSLFTFYKKRVYRIFPLYWASLLSLVILFEVLKLNAGNVVPYQIDFINFLVHFLALQVFFPDYQIQSMWFIGTILLYYFLYSIFISSSKKLLYSLIYSLLIILPLALLHLLFNLVSINVFLYYGIFLCGVFSNKLNLFNGNIFPNIFSFFNSFKHSKYQILCMSIFSFLALFGFFKFDSRTASVFAYIIYKNLLMLALILITYRGLKLVVSLSADKICIFSYISYSSYCVYLFHHQIFSMLRYCLGNCFNGYVFDLFFLFTGFPLVFFLGYQIQKSFDVGLAFLKTNRVLKKKPIF